MGGKTHVVGRYAGSWEEGMKMTYTKSGEKGRKDGNRRFIRSTRSTRSLSSMFIKYNSKIHKVGRIVQGDN